MQKIIVHNGKVWEQAELHLKSAIPGYHYRNIAKQIALDLLQQAISSTRAR